MKVDCRAIAIFSALWVHAVSFSPVDVQIRKWSGARRWMSSNDGLALSRVSNTGTELHLSSIAESVPEIFGPLGIDVTAIHEEQSEDSLVKREQNRDEWIRISLLIGAGLVLLPLCSSIDIGTVREAAAHGASHVWDVYSDVLARSPVQTKACTSGIVYGIGDVIAQRTEGKSIQEMDRMRVVRSMTAGFIGHGPLSHVWYNVCDFMFEDVIRLTAWWAFLPKILVDQTAWGPVWNNTYILLIGLMKMDSLPTIWANMKRTTIPLILSGLKLWPLAHCVTYGLIPVENRLLWVDMVEILWVIVLASQAAGHGSSVVVSEPVEVPEDADSNTVSSPAIVI